MGSKSTRVHPKNSYVGFYRGLTTRCMADCTRVQSFPVGGCHGSYLHLHLYTCTCTCTTSTPLLLLSHFAPALNFAQSPASHLLLIICPLLSAPTTTMQHLSTSAPTQHLCTYSAPLHLCTTSSAAPPPHHHLCTLFVPTLHMHKNHLCR